VQPKPFSGASDSVSHYPKPDILLHTTCDALAFHETPSAVRVLVIRYSSSKVCQLSTPSPSRLPSTQPPLHSSMATFPSSVSSAFVEKLYLGSVRRVAWYYIAPSHALRHQPEASSTQPDGDSSINLRLLSGRFEPRRNCQQKAAISRTRYFFNFFLLK